MSEQEKMNVVPAEGTVNETKDERTLLKKFVDNHPKAWKWAKRIGAGVGIAGGLLGAFELGRTTGPKMEPLKLVGESTDDEEADDEEVSEE